MKTIAGCTLSSLVVGVLSSSLAGLAPAAEEAAVITRQQIESDWLRQDEVRGKVAVVAETKVTPEEDAIGGCDGVKDSKWGFHTENEDYPWWQVDLGQPIALERMLVYNRCDSMAGRNARMIALLSDDGKSFKQVYQHDGTTFYGHSDEKPLEVKLAGAKARYVRLQLPGKSYFHLDEVELYAVGDTKNVALGKPATQSSTSQWSVPHRRARSARQLAGDPGPAETAQRTAEVVDRGLKLAENLQILGVDVQGDIDALKAIATQAADGRMGSAHQEEKEETAVGTAHPVVAARWAVRKLALKNPLLDFDTILFIKAAPTQFPHQSDQFYGWWSRPGGGVFLLSGWKGAQSQLRCLTAGWPVGSYLRPDLSYDGKKVVFAYCRFYPHVPEIQNKADKANLPEDAFYHIIEMNLDGSGVRQLTHGRYDDFDARYLPGGQLVFLSTRKGQFLQCSTGNSGETAKADLPDSYVRCGGDNYRPVPVFTLHVMDADGGNLRPISAFENFEWTPAVANDGRILYTRWDYIDRFNGHFFSLWSTNPDGSHPQLVYGNYTVRPQVIHEPRPIPNSHKLICTASAHHSITGGSLILLDRHRGTEEAAPLVRLTPEVCFPETEGWPQAYYANSYPLSEEHYLVAWSDRKLPPHARVDNTEQNPINAMGIYLYDAFGNLNLIYRDPEISSTNPLPVRPRPKPPVYADTAAWDGPQEGRFLVQDVYQGLAGVERGEVRRIRVVGVPPKVQPHMNTPVLGISKEDPGKFVLGTVPVEADGSAYFRVPSGISLFFQALDGDGLTVQTMRSLTYVQPSQTLSCIGCHESRETAPAVSRPPQAALREPSKLTPGPRGSWPLRFDQLVQPVLDQHCVRCHSPQSGNEKAARLDLMPTKAYDNLLAFADKDLERLAFERDRSVVGESVARKSKLFKLLTQADGHEGVFLDADALQRLVTWMDVYAQRLGHFSEQQESQLRDLRQRLAPLLAEP